MGKSKAEKQQAIQAHKQARADLETVSRRDQCESDAYLAANSKVAETEKNVPWYRR